MPAQHQREVAVAIKSARELALLPYAQRSMSAKGPVRGPGRKPATIHSSEFEEVDA